MNGLPDVEIASKRPTTVPMSGTVYELTFVPPGATGSYRRTHVVLLGEQHVFHLIETAPSETTSGSAIVTKLIDSFREEV